MPVHNADLAAALSEIADLLELEEANPFRVRAYRNAARQLQSLPVPVTDLVAKGEALTDLPGIGADLAAKLEELLGHGTCALLEELRQRRPPSITALLKVPALGPKRVRILCQELQVHTLEELAHAAREGRIRELPGFGAKIEQTILQAISRHTDQAPRFQLPVAAEYAEPLRRYLAGVDGVGQVVVAGSYRRCRESVGDLDLLVTARDPMAVMDRFVSYDDVQDLLAKGPTRGSVRLKCGLQVDLRVVPEPCFGAALLYFTGSKAHNIELRRLAQDRKLKVSEYGVFAGERRVAGETEASVYRALDLPWIPPELRENQGEIAAAREGRLPELVELAHLRGDLHSHSRATDGHHTVREMAEAARACGLEYLAITDHSRRLAMAREEIDRLNQELAGISLLKGVEVDILEDGQLDLPDETLAELDLVVGAVHGKFNLSAQEQTERILQAMDHPYFTILAHPTGRLLDSREPYPVDLPRVIEKARSRGCFLELNAHPERLDLTDVHCRMARERGVLVAIDSDGHSTRDFQQLRCGIGQARRGWLGQNDVLNARPLADLRPLLARTMRK